MYSASQINPDNFDDQHQENNSSGLPVGMTVPLAVNEDEHMTRIYIVKPLAQYDDLFEMT